VGTKADLVNADPSKREVPFDRCIAYAAEHLGDDGGGIDTCHEISARDDQGVDEVFRVIARKLVDRRAAELDGMSYGGNGDGSYGGNGGVGEVDTQEREEKRKGGKCC
jgi:hypothetical protein